MAWWKQVGLWTLFALIALSVLYPNPFGNNPDIIWDESYFLTTGLSSIQHHILPGWDFSASGAYYGGPQAYIDTAVLVPAIAIIFTTHQFSFTATQVWVALNTGELLHLLRLVSGVLALGAILCCFFYFKRKKLGATINLSLTLFVSLLLSNVLIIEFLHTAKMWTLYIIFVALASTFFLAQEYSLREGAPVMPQKRYVALLIWLGLLTFFQSFVGAFSTLLIFLYALILKHFSVWDVWNHVKRWWWLMVLLCVTQISFAYHAFVLRQQFVGVATTTTTGAIDWASRFVQPLLFALEGDPLVVLYPLSSIVLLYAALAKRSFFTNRSRSIRIGVAFIHPLLTYLFFHIGIGFDILPRYAILLTLSCALSLTILATEFGKRVVIGVLSLSTILAAVIFFHAIPLYWSASSETVLLETIEAKYNTPSNIFIIDHSARRMTLPMNLASLQLLDQDRAAMSRFQYLLAHQDALPSDNPFKATTVTAYLPEEQDAYLQRFEKTGNSLWIISRNECMQSCSAEEIANGRCFQINAAACDLEPQEINTLPVFLSATELGYSYLVRRVY
jgi:hypothetical protein